MGKQPRGLRSEPSEWPEHLRSFVPSSSSQQERPGIGAFRSLASESTDVRERALTALAPGTVGRCSGTLLQRQPQWLQQRSLAFHVEHRAIERPGDDARSSRQLSLLTANFGCLERLGVNAAGIQEETRVQSYLAGKFHLLLLQEAYSLDFKRTLRTFGYSFVTRCGGNLFDCNGWHGQTANRSDQRWELCEQRGHERMES